MRRPHTAAVLLLLWLAVLTVAFHGCGRRFRCGAGFFVATPTTKRTGPVLLAVVPRKMLLAVTTTSSFDTTVTASPPTNHHHHHHHHHHQHQHHHLTHHRRHHRAGRWNWDGVIPPSSTTAAEEFDPRYGVEKRLVPTGPNPLHH